MSDIVGFLGRDGRWVTVETLEEELGDEMDTSVIEALEGLAEIDIVNTIRTERGSLRAVQASEFACDLYALPEDAPPWEVAAVYMDHEKDVPEEIEDEWREEFQTRKEEFES